jgi:hypothetical protein
MQLTKKQKAENEKHGIMDRQNDNNVIKTNIARENEEGTGGEEVKEAATAPFYIEKEFNVIEHLFATHSRRLAVEMHRVRQSDEFKYNAPGQEQVIAGLATECACSLALHVRAAVDAIKKQYVYKEDIKEFLERVKNLARWHEEMLFTSNGVEVFVGTWKRVCDEVY